MCHVTYSEAGAEKAIQTLGNRRVFPGATREMTVKYAETPEEQQKKKTTLPAMNPMMFVRPWTLTAQTVAYGCACVKSFISCSKLDC